ncbi:hypothetical protein BY996DRAFT_4592426 [Phakopsora pachyrhizi]|nr:hypothetical protein BY996DRAFT_4592426 [Phakopsora pachyrhizi]
MNTSPIEISDQLAFQSDYNSFSRSRSSTLPIQNNHPSQSQPQKSSINNRTSISARKSRQLPQFNVLVLGARSTGKTRFLETLVGTFVPSLPNQVESLQFKKIVSTTTLNSKSYSVTNLAGDRTVLNLVDSAGLDISSGDEFRVDLQMNEILRYVEDKFEESLQIERQVHRNPSRLGESHVHVSVYFIDPSTITHRESSGGSPTYQYNSTEDESESEHMSPIDLRQLKRLSRRSNILPVIGRSDELTEKRILKLKEIVQSDLKTHGISLGAFDSGESEELDSEETSTSPDESGSNDQTEGDQIDQSYSKSGEDQTTGANKRLTRRKSVSMPNSARRRRSSMMNFLREELASMKDLIPLSIFGAEFLPSQGLEDDDFERLNHSYPFSLLSRESKKGSIYVRKFRWATIDVLNPNHCEFVLIRAILLGSHLAKLKESTRIDKYENYRTEKLLSRRITINQGLKGIEEQRKIAMEVEKIEIPHIHSPKSIFGLQAEMSGGFQAPITSSSQYYPQSQRHNKSTYDQAQDNSQQYYPMSIPPSNLDSSRKLKTYSSHFGRIMKKSAPHASQSPNQPHDAKDIPRALSTSHPPLPTPSAPQTDMYPRSQSGHSTYAAEQSMNRPMVF